jgi:hypothetical protein
MGWITEKAPLRAIKLYVNSARGFMQLVKSLDELPSVPGADVRKTIDSAVKVYNSFRGGEVRQFVVVRDNCIIAVEEPEAGKLMWCEGNDTQASTPT